MPAIATKVATQPTRAEPKAKAAPKAKGDMKANTLLKPKAVLKAKAVPKPKAAPKAKAIVKRPAMLKATTLPKPQAVLKANAWAKPKAAPKATAIGKKPAAFKFNPPLDAPILAGLNVQEPPVGIIVNDVILEKIITRPRGISFYDIKTGDNIVLVDVHNVLEHTAMCLRCGEVVETSLTRGLMMLRVSWTPHATALNNPWDGKLVGATFLGYASGQYLDIVIALGGGVKAPSTPDAPSTPETHG